MHSMGIQHLVCDVLEDVYTTEPTTSSEHFNCFGTLISRKTPVSTNMYCIRAC